MLDFLLYLRVDYYVIIRVKPMVKKYLESRYGSPVSFLNESIGSGAHFNHMLKRMLSKPSFQGDKKRSGINYKANTRLVEVKIKISAYWFYNIGWSISTTDQMAFNSFVESIVKENLLILVKSNKGKKITDIINLFREMYSIDEDSYPYETIKKYLYREGIKKNIIPNVPIF